MNCLMMANSQQMSGLNVYACEIACVMAHNDEQHVLSQHHFIPELRLSNINSNVVQ